MARGRADYSIELEEGLDLYDQAEFKALVAFNKDGLTLHEDLPTSKGRNFDGRIPENLSSMSPREIGEIYNLMVAYTDYVAGRAILAKATLTAADEKLKLVKAKVRKAKLGTVQEKDDDSLIDSRYVEANASVLEARTYFDLTSAAETAARRDLKFISRIIETKKIEFEQGRRGEGLDGGRRGNTFRRRSG